uniref:Cap-specific mRNA (nucleoside-2'-O-)-methyltransferase 2 n=1 Tax=Leptobrachium leishanense TaxID=445787 RepID=A0A8C5Q6F2_9ANUR
MSGDTCECQVYDEISTLFNKRFLYVQEADWVLPHASEVFTQNHEEFEELQVLKGRLNKVKDLLSDKKLDDWHRHTSFTNMAGKVVSEVRKFANAELCTQAWCKLHEILCTYSIIPSDSMWNGELNTVHLCEAPGAFVSCLNHFLKTREYLCDWNWVANTLNPYHEANDGLVMIADDRLIANTLPWWFFGPDNTGDIMSLKHLTGLQNFTSNMSAVHLVTADGSFDCQGNPGEQESLVAPLHYCEVVTALTLLDQDGSFILKMFTLYEHSSVNLMYLLNCCFRHVHVIKPGTSKAGNSEVYIVCLGYLGKKVIQDILSKMTQSFGAAIANKSLFPHRSVPASFLRIHRKCCKVFFKYQEKTIRENLFLFDNMGPEGTTWVTELRDYAANYFLKRMLLKRISRKQWIVKKQPFGSNVNSRWVGVRVCRSESYNERKHLETLTWPEKVVNGYFSPWLEQHIQSILGADCILQASDAELQSAEWYIIEGQRLPRVRSSTFCDNQLLKTLNETIEGISVDPAITLSCPRCSTVTAQAVGQQVLKVSGSIHRILVCGAHSLYQFLVEGETPSAFLECPLLSRGLSVLHDGDPAHQRDFTDMVSRSLQRLQHGDSLVLPVLSCFTRLVAGMLYMLHHCFQVITFTCPTSVLAPGADAFLVCCGFSAPSDPVLVFLEQLKQRTEELASPGATQQVLQFIPMECLLDGPVPEFLWTLNAAILRSRLHERLLSLQHWEF